MSCRARTFLPRMTLIRPSASDRSGAQASYADPPHGERRDLKSRGLKTLGLERLGLERLGLERLGLERLGDSAIFSDSPQPAPQVSGALKH